MPAHHGTLAKAVYADEPKTGQLDKQAFDLSLLGAGKALIEGGAGHVGTNLLGKGIHNYTNLAERLAQKGLQQGLEGREALGGGRGLAKLLYGPEALMEYDAALNAGKAVRAGAAQRVEGMSTGRLAALKDQLVRRNPKALQAQEQGWLGRLLGSKAPDAAAAERAALIDFEARHGGGMSLATLARGSDLGLMDVYRRSGDKGVKALREAPVLGSVMSALRAERSGQKIEARANDSGMVSTVLGGLINALPGRHLEGITSWGSRKRIGDYGKLERGLMNVGAGVGAAAPVIPALLAPQAAAAAALGGSLTLGGAAAGLGIHGAINAARYGAGETEALRNVMLRQGLESGLSGKPRSLLGRLGDKAQEYLISPAMTSGRRLGESLHEAGLTNEGMAAAQYLRQGSKLERGQAAKPYIHQALMDTANRSAPAVQAAGRLATNLDPRGRAARAPTPKRSGLSEYLPAAAAVGGGVAGGGLLGAALASRGTGQEAQLA